jgi:tetratricopeptide (TPR) repeat protein
MSENSDMNKHLKLFWAIMLGILGLITALTGLLKDYSWTANFLPDWVFLCILLSVFYSSYPKLIIPLFASVRAIISNGGNLRRLCVIGLILILVIGLVLNIKQLEPYYRARLFYAKFDWHFAQGRGYLRKGLYEQAVREFDKQGNHFSYLPETTLYIAKKEALDTKRRLIEVNSYLDRFNEAIKSNNPPNYMDLLLAQRAFKLYPESQRVLRAREIAKRQISQALIFYFKAIELLQNNRQDLARQELVSSRKNCQNLLHQDLLLRYCNLFGKIPFNSEESKVLDFYLRTPLNEIKETVFDLALIKWAS